MAHEFRSTPQLGPALSGKATQFYWDAFPTTFVNSTGTVNDTRDASYRLGNKEVGTDGHDYVLVKASATIASGAFTINETTWATDTGTGWSLPPDIQAAGGVTTGQYFHARKATL